MAASLACVLLLLVVGAHAQCDPTITTASGDRAPDTICAGALIFDEQFDTLDLRTWEHELTAAGGGNWEFQVYVNNRSNSFVQDGVLHIKPTLTADRFGEAFLSSGVLSLYGGSPADWCTNPQFFGCERQGTGANIVNPITSARIRTVNSFRFKYGKVEVRAQMPSGDWLWPAIWMLPRDNAYSTWPQSGEIDITECRGNKNLVSNGVNIGSEQSGSTLHFGPYGGLNGWEKAHFTKNTAAGQGYDTDFHRYQVEWTDSYIKFSIDDVELGTITPPAGGFYELGDFASQVGEVDNSWKYGNIMAPFDQEFYLILNLAVGGVGYFPDGAENPGGKPWVNTSPTAATDFWNGRGQWLPTWNLDVNGGVGAALKVDYVKVWAI